jgi:hypothetical protein
MLYEQPIVFLTKRIVKPARVHQRQAGLLIKTRLVGCHCEEAQPTWQSPIEERAFCKSLIFRCSLQKAD